MTFEKALIKLIQQATEDRWNEIARMIEENQKKNTNSFHYINQKLNKLTMSQKTDFDALIARLDAASNKEAESQKALQAQIAEITKNAGLSEEEENQIKAAFEARIAFLEGLGKPENPVPEPAPVEPAPTEPPVEPAPAEGGDVTPPATDEVPA